MLKFTKDSYVDVDLYEERLNHNGYIAMELDAIKDKITLDRELAWSNMQIARNIMYHNSGCSYYHTSASNAVASYLQFYENCPERYFKLRGRDKEKSSLDSKKVLIPLMQNGHAQDFLFHYTLSKSITSKCNKMAKLIGRCTESAGKNHNDKETIKVYTTAASQVNRRFAYHDEDVIALPKDYAKTICADNPIDSEDPDEEYLIAWGDFKQADLRNAINMFILDESNADVFLKYSDKYEATSRIVEKTMNKEFDLEQFSAERPMYKRKVLSVINGTRSSVVQSEQEFVKKFADFLSKCPKYAEFERRIRDRIEMDLPVIVETYFGHSEVAVTNNNDANATLNFALNSPFQGTTSEILILTVNTLLDQFYALGYTEEDISVFFVRHDEPLFKLKRKVLKDAWIFNNASEILVDDWMPLALTFEFGYNYLVPDEELNKLAELSYEKNKDRIDIYERSEPSVEPFFPLKPTFVVTAQWQVVADKTILTFYSERGNAVDYLLIDATDSSVIKETILQKIRKASDKIKADGYQGIIVYNPHFDHSEIISGSNMVKFIKKVDPSMNRVCVLTDYMATRYAKKIGDSFYKPPLEVDVPFVEGVERLGYVF